MGSIQCQPKKQVHRKSINNIKKRAEPSIHRERKSKKKFPSPGTTMSSCETLEGAFPLEVDWSPPEEENHHLKYILNHRVKSCNREGFLTFEDLSIRPSGSSKGSLVANHNVNCFEPKSSQDICVKTVKDIMLRKDKRPMFQAEFGFAKGSASFSRWVDMRTLVKLEPKSALADFIRGLYLWHGQTYLRMAKAASDEGLLRDLSLSRQHQQILDEVRVAAEKRRSARSRVASAARRKAELLRSNV